jgi:hypothetical protein
MYETVAALLVGAQYTVVEYERLSRNIGPWLENDQ